MRGSDVALQDSLLHDTCSKVLIPNTCERHVNFCPLVSEKKNSACIPCETHSEVRSSFLGLERHQQ